MTAAQAALRLVEEVPDALVTIIIGQLRSGGSPSVPNPSHQLRVNQFVKKAEGPGSELAAMLEVAQQARRVRPKADLVWTGPNSTVVPVRQTEHVLVDLVQNAEKTLTMASFGIYQIPALVSAIENAFERHVSVRMLFGDQEARSKWALESQIKQLGEMITAKAGLYRWPLHRRLRDAAGNAGLMHAKFVVADSSIAFLTSANFTETAFERNMELGVVLRGGDTAATIDRIVDALIESGDLQSVWGSGLSRLVPTKQ